MTWFEHGTSRIYYEISGSGEPILLMPGCTGSIREFAALTEILVAAGYQVVTADLPGSGRSEPQPRHYTAAYYDDDTHSFTALLQHVGVKSAHLMGFSDGGEVSLLMAALTPEIARSVVTWGAVGSIHDPEGQLRNMLYNVVDNPIPPMREFSEALKAAYGEANARAMTQSVSIAYGEIAAAGGDISKSKVGNISCPVLLIAGEHDFLATPALVSELATHIRTAEVLEVKGAGHDPLHMTRTEWFAQILLDWMKQQQKAGV